MRKLLTSGLFTLLFLLFTNALYAQVFFPPNQPEQDACNAVKLCQPIYSTTLTYQGYGALQQMSNACAPENAWLGSASAGGGTMWLELDIATGGNIVFTITPHDTADDYDFAVVNITNIACSTASFPAANILRCDANDNYGSSPGGVVGLNTTALGTYQGPGPGPAFLQQITAVAGDKYLVMINFSGNYSNPSHTPAGFTFNMSASTATLMGNGVPMLDTITQSCDYSSNLSIHLTQPVLCSSLQANGSDFRISPAAATVSAASGTGCVGPVGNTQYLSLSFSNALPAGNYWLVPKNGTDGNTLLNACGVALPTSDSIPFHVEGPLTVNLGPDTVTCIHNSIQLNAVIGGGPFTNTTIQWSPATYLNSATITNPVATPTANVVYTVTVTPDHNGACSKSATLHVDVLQGFILANHDTTICKGQSVLLTALGDTRYTYTWSPTTFLTNGVGASTTSTPDSTTSYTVVASHLGCYDSANHITIGVQPVPSVYIGPDITVCYGDTLHMTPQITPSNYLNYSFAWTPAQYFNFPSSRDPIFLAQDTAQLVLTVTTPIGCTGSATRKISVIPNHFSAASNDTGICPRDTAQLHIVGGVSYVWNPTTYIDSVNGQNPKVSPVTSTTYTVIATNSLNCRDTQRVYITVHPEAVINLPDSVTLYPGESYQLDPRGNCLYFTWFPLLGLSNPEIANPTAMPQVNTHYYAYGKTEFGCAATDSIVIIEDYESLIDVPNAFVPGNGLNNILKPVHRGEVTLNYFRVFDRWGTKVYESTDVDAGWDGQYHGSPQPLGVYIYTIRATLPSGRVFNKQGNVTLLR